MANPSDTGGRTVLTIKEEDDSSDDSASDDSAEEQEEQEDVDLDSDDESNAGGTAALPDGTESENQPAAAAVKATPTTPARPRAEEGGC